MTASTDDLPEGFIESDEQPFLTPDIIAQLRETASSRSRPTMTFGRKFDLETARQCKAHWWRDLLTLWRPAGVPAGDTGLRLAVRNSYLNFYRKGQSVGRVEVKKGQLVCYVHAKYVRPENATELGQDYVRVVGDDLFLKGESIGQYGGAMTVSAWASATSRWSGPEKRAIDAALDLSDNVIDLEMGQPGTGLRMDMVCIERDGPELWVAFWEAKLAADSRVRCRGDAIPKTFPKVLEQLAHYEEFIAADGNSQRVADAYQATASVLIGLRDLADAMGPTYPLGQEILDAAKAPTLRVRPNARLLIFEPDERAWPKHMKKLQDAGVDLLVAANSEKVVWGGRA